MYILTKHVMERFSERDINFAPDTETSEELQDDIQKLLKQSKPCILSRYHRVWRRMVHDIKDGVKSYYRFAGGWTFVIVKDKFKRDIVVTAYYKLKPKPKII